jgi:hypothetical protein
MPEFQKPEDPDEFNEAYGRYETLVEQFKEFRRVLQGLQDRLEGKEEEEAPFVFPDEHRRLQVLDAVRQIVGGGMGHWILTESPYSSFIPTNPAAPSLSKLGWKAVFRACTPPEYFHLFLDRPFESVRGWADVLDSHLKALAKPRRAIATKPKVPPVSKVHKEPKRPTTTGMNSARSTEVHVRYDPSVGVERHYLRGTDYQQFRKQEGHVAKIQWLMSHLKTTDVPPAAKASAQEGYQRRLKDLQVPDSPSARTKKPAQTSFRERPRRSGERKDYSWRGQQKHHEGQVRMVQTEPEEPMTEPVLAVVKRMLDKRPSSTRYDPAPEKKYPSDWEYEENDSASEHDPLSFDLEDEVDNECDPLFLGTVQFDRP